MASRYEHIFLLKDIQNNPDAPVEIMAGAVINDVITQEKSIQLKFRITESQPAKMVIFDVVSYDEFGNELSKFPLTYEYPMQPGIPLGTDVITPFDDNSVASFSIAVNKVVFSGFDWSVEGGKAEIPAKLVIIRDRQFFLVNPDIKVWVDGKAIQPLSKNGTIELELAQGVHEFTFKMSFRETTIIANFMENCDFTVSCNRITGKLDIIKNHNINYQLVKHV